MVGMTYGLSGRRVDLHMVWWVFREWIDLHVVWRVGELVGSLVGGLTCGSSGGGTCVQFGNWVDLMAVSWVG